MAVTATVTRNLHSFDSATTSEYCTAALTGTYATGGFTWNPFAVTGAKGTSPMPGKTLLQATFISPNGYTYVTTLSGSTATTKILSAAGTELANAAAVPDASLSLILLKTKV